MTVPRPASYHDSHPIHHLGGEVYLKREGDTILVYPGPVRLTLSEWASAVAFTTPDGESGPLHKVILSLVGRSS